MAFEQVTTRTPTLVGHVQLILSDGRHSDSAGTVVAGTPADDMGTQGMVIVLDQDDENMDKKRASDATPYLSAASQQKLLEVVNELRVTLGGLLLP